MLLYRVFSLTCWQDEDPAPEPEKWRFRLEEPQKGEQHGFTNLEALTAFLQARLKETDDVQEDCNSSTLKKDTEMKYRKCPVCKLEIEAESPICIHCNKGVFVVDFGDSAARLIAGGFFDRPNVYEICGWHDIIASPAVPSPKPPTEWRCEKYEPKVFLEE